MKRLLCLILLLISLPVLASAETLVTSFYPVWILTRNLTEGIDGMEVINMAASTTGCLHDYTLQTIGRAHV